MNAEAFLIEENVAIAHCIFEILENVGKIFGNQDRAQKLYRVINLFYIFFFIVERFFFFLISEKIIFWTFIFR